jgi:hypothetical protein
MSFTARCPFCHIKLNGVPAEHEGCSICCPRCESYFTLAAANDSRLRSRKCAGSHSSPGLAVKEAPTQPHKSAPLPAGCIMPGKIEELSCTATGQGQAINRFGVLAFLLGTLALLCASIPGGRLLIVPLACTGLVAAGLGLVVPSARKAGLRLVAAGGAVSAIVLAIALCAPTILHLPAQATASKPSADIPTVYRQARPRDFQRLAPQKTEWVNASQEAVQQAGVRVRVRGVAVRQVPLKDGAGRRRLSERGLVIRLRISNAEADRLVEYQGWSATPASAPRLEDDMGRFYPLKDLGPDPVMGQLRHALLPMAKWVDDVLVFEAPEGNIAWLRLELPCAALGLKGQFRLEIPRRMIAYQ